MKIPAYPKYKASGVEWLGDVPEGWEIKRLKMSARLTDKKVEADEENSMPYIGMENIESWTGKLLPLDTDVVPSGVASMFSKRNTLFGKLRPYLAKACNPNFDGLCSTELLVIDSDDFDKRALLYWLLTEGFIDLVDSSTYGSKMPRANWDFIGNCLLPVPSPSEQQKIADFLDWKTGQIDALIAKKKLLIEKLKEKRIALITHAVTKGLNPNAKMKDSGIPWLGEVPEHWEVRRLKFCCDVTGGGTPNTSNPEYWDGDIPWVSPKDMKLRYISTTEDQITNLGLQDSATTMISSNSLLIVVRSGILRHTIPVAINIVSVSINQDMKAIVPLETILISPYLMALIFGNQKSLLPLWSKSGCTVESIEMENLLNFEIPLPPINEQVAIAKLIETKWEKIDLLENRLETVIKKLTEYRTALITSATTGKINVQGSITNYQGSIINDQ